MNVIGSMIQNKLKGDLLNENKVCSINISIVIIVRISFVRLFSAAGYYDGNFHTER